jgi:hypothetical protein
MGEYLEGEDVESEGSIGLAAFEEHRHDIACHIVMNLVLAGEIRTTDLGLVSNFERMPLDELIQVLCRSHELREEQGLPLVYRMNGIMN